MINKIRNFAQRNWRGIVAVLCALLVVAALLYATNDTTKGMYTAGELAAKNDAASLQTIIHNPINAPFKLLVLGLSSLGQDNLAATRIISGFFAIGFVALFYWVARYWFSKRIAILGLALFVGSSMFLHVARYGEPLILSLVPLVLVASILLYQRTRRQTLAAYVLVALIGFSLYIPGAIWFTVLGLIILGTRTATFIRKQGLLHTVLLTLLFLILLSPLILAGARDTSIFTGAAGLPSTMPSWDRLVDNAKNIGEALIYRGYYSSEYTLYGAPLLNIAEVTLLLAGLVTLWLRPRLHSNYFLLGSILIALLLVIANGGMNLTILMPFIYLTIAAGIYFILDQWLTVFPRNPIARAAGVALLIIVVAFSVMYHLRAYYVAWPSAPETKQVYIIKSE